MTGEERYIFSDEQEIAAQDLTAEFQQKAKTLFSRYSPAQAEAHRDPCRWRAILASRRTGKSFFCGTELFGQCLLVPHSNCVYITLTKGSGRGILWSFLQHMDREFQLGCHFHGTNLVVTFKNGSRIQFIGADNKSEIDKLRGQGYDLVVIDECKSYVPATLEELLQEVLEPALMDRQGKLIMIGTPGSILAGPFYEITEKNLTPEAKSPSRPWVERELKIWKKKKYKWSFHRWGMDDAALDHIRTESYAIKEAYGWDDDHPAWVREYMGQWVASDEALVYYGYNKKGDGFNNWDPDPESENVHGLPDGHEWHYVLGLDLGWTDDVAIEVIAYSPTHPDAYQVYDYKSPNLIVPDIAEQIDICIGIFGDIEHMVGDTGGLGKLLIETLAAQYGHDVEPAEKRDKIDHIKLLNADLLQGRIKVKRDSLLVEEWETLQWDKTKQKEDPNCANHASDAFLYIWRYLYHHYWEERRVEPAPGTNEWWKKKDDEAFEQACSRFNRADSEDWWDTPFSDDMESPWN